MRIISLLLLFILTISTVKAQEPYREIPMVMTCAPIGIMFKDRINKRKELSIMTLDIPGDTVNQIWIYSNVFTFEWSIYLFMEISTSMYVLCLIQDGTGLIIDSTKV